MSDTTILAAEQAVTEQALAWPDRARAIRIVDAESYRFAGEMLLGIKALRKEVDATFDPNIRRWLDGHRAAIADKRKAETPLADAETILKRGLGAYDTEQERLQREAERIAQELARKAAEDAALAEAAALEIEAAATGDVALQQAADDIIATPVVVPTVSVAKATPKVAGISYTETWKAEVTDFGALVQFIAAHPVYLPLLAVNATAMNQQARSLRSSLQLPGVKVYAEKGVRAGGAR